MIPLANKICPLCDEANQCAPANTGNFEVPCWCATADVRSEALASIPAAKLNKSCLCPQCAEGSTERPELETLTFVLSEFPMLSETFILNQIAHFIAQGVDVKLVSMNRSSSGLDHPWVTRYALMDKVRYVFDRNQTWHKFATLLGSIASDILHGRAATLKQLWTLGAKSYLLSRAIPATSNAIICHFGHIGGEVARVKALKPGANFKLITFFHGADVSIRSHLEHYQQNYQTLFSHGDLMLPISQFWATRLADMGCPAQKIQVQHMGVELDSFSFLSRYDHRPAPAPVQLIAVCRFVEKKGLPVLVECMSLLGSGYRLTVIGGGTMVAEIEQQIRELGLEDRIILSGPLPSHEVEIRLGHADAFVLPSVTGSNGDMEGIPVALMEAMAKGLLVFSTRHSGIPELIEDGVNGHLVAEKDAQQLADRIRHTFESQTSEQRQRTADAARHTIETSFNVKLLNGTLMSRIAQLSALS